MGLDMYLNRCRQERPYFHEDDLFDWNQEGASEKYQNEVADIQLACWRKSNWIHKWFVDRVQDGVDECQYPGSGPGPAAWGASQEPIEQPSRYVTRADLENLVVICRRIQEDHDLAEELLPVQQGFFFGGYQYDEWYFKDLKDTVNQLAPVIENWQDDWRVYYHSSW
jgi:hypothetical protein